MPQEARKAGVSKDDPASVDFRENWIRPSRPRRGTLRHKVRSGGRVVIARSAATRRSRARRAPQFSGLLRFARNDGLGVDLPQATPSSALIAASSRSPSSTSNGLGGAIAASAASARRSDAPESTGVGGRHGASLLEVAVAMQDDIEPRLDHRGGAFIERTLQRLHRQVVAHDEAVEPDFAAHDLLDDDRRRSRRTPGIDRGVEDDARSSPSAGP